MHPSSSSLHLLTQRWRGTPGEPVLCVSAPPSPADGWGALHQRCWGWRWQDEGFGWLQDGGCCWSRCQGDTGSWQRAARARTGHVAPSTVAVLGWGTGGCTLSSLTPSMQPDWLSLFWLQASFDGRPSHPPVPAAHPRPSPPLPQQDTGIAFCLPCLSFLFPGHSHSLSMNPVSCISSSTFLSPSYFLNFHLTHCPAPSIPSSPTCFLPFSPSTSLPQDIYSSPSPPPAALRPHRQGRVPVPGGCNPLLPEGHKPHPLALEVLPGSLGWAKLPPPLWRSWS